MRLAVFLIAVVAALALVPLLGNAFHVTLMTKVAALAIFAMSLDLLLGVAGLVSFGHAAFFGLAAYGVAMLAPEYDAANLLTILPQAIGVSALAALAIGSLSLRTSGIYFIMVTLAFGQMAFFAIHDTAFFGGSDGKLIFAKPVVALGETQIADLSNGDLYYWVCLGFVVLSYLVLAGLKQSPFGHILQGIRSNEQRMRALGYRTYVYKLIAFVIAGALAGLAGVLAAYQAEYVSPALLGWKESGMGLMMVILGGSNTFWGPALGALALTLAQEGLKDLTGHWMGLLGLAIVLVVVFAKGGLAGVVARVLGRRP